MKICYQTFRRCAMIFSCLFFVFIGRVPIVGATSSPTSTTGPVGKQIRVLIIPGHEPNLGGTVFRGLKERDLTAALGLDLQQLLAQDPHFQVTMTRDSAGWNPVLWNYFTKHWTDIISWEKASKKTFANQIATGVIQKPVSTVGHNAAPANVAIRLYGMNKWANENNIDIVINIHFDDEGAHRYNVPGRYSGFAIYDPAPQYDNYLRSQDVAKIFLRRLQEVEPVSNLPGETDGIIDEPKLISVGENNTSITSNVLIEYGFIYEKKFTDPKLRAQSLEDLAQKTYQALEEYRLQGK